MGIFDKVPGRPSNNENEIAEKVAIQVRKAISSQSLVAGPIVDALIGEYVAKYASDSSRTIFRKVKSLI